MKRTIQCLSLAGALLAAASASAYNEDFGKAKTGTTDKPVMHTRGAGCAPANYRLTMSFNDVSCQLETGGLLFLDRANGVATYKVPKTGLATAIYAGSLWMGGVDTNGQLKIAAVLFRNQGNDFWPGPLTTTPGSGNYSPLIPQGDNVQRPYGDANADPSVCATYDNIFTIRKAEVIAFITWWECGHPNPFNPQHLNCDDVDPPNNEIMGRIAAWPGNGDQGLYQDPYLAPYFDRDANGGNTGGDGVYNPGDGDYPWFDDILGRNDVVCGTDRRPTLYGDECNWWVFNDKGNIHTESGGDPIGMEIRAQAFSFASDDEINKMTFYNYEMVNRGTQTLYNTYFSQYVDVDLGGYNDDYVGCDVSRGLGYCYNGDLDDQTVNGKTGYGANPPAIGVDFFEGPYQDSDGKDNPLSLTTDDALDSNGIVYPGLGIGYGDSIVDNERFGMRRFCYFNSMGQQQQMDPSSSAQFYNYMKGLWRSGAEMYYGGTGFNPSTGVTTTKADYMFPDDSDPLFWGTQGNATSFDWSEYDADGTGINANPPGDRRFVQSAGPFTLRPGAVNNITVGIVFARSAEGSLLASVKALKQADTKAQALFDHCFQITDPPNAPVLTVQELNNELILMINNPKLISNNDGETYAQEDNINIQDPPGITYDKVYHFEGYQIFQMKSVESTIADIDDPTKARLVAQCDIKNGISRLINFEFVEEFGFTVPSEKVDGEDKGIRHTFRITEDQFATGNRTLVNHKTYYYIAVAYAYNNYKPYDPSDPTKLDGQKLPYMRSRINADGTPLSPLSAVPHNPSPELGGTIQSAIYGQTPRITRLDGFGNGNNALELTSASEDAIVASGYLSTPEYASNGGPINVKVVDPLNLVGGYFECRFTDYGDIDTASWVISRYTEKDGTFIDSVTSEQTIEMDNEQIIPGWGVSVQIHQVLHYIPQGSGNETAKITDPISASYAFADSSKRWLAFIQDDQSFTPQNWIRTGTYNPSTDPTLTCNPLPSGYESQCLYGDELGKDPKEMYSKLLSGGIAPQRVVGYQGAFMPLAYPASFVSYSGSRNRASISFAPSIDIVITSDPTKWTRCPVIELGRDENLNIGGAKPGELRKSPSLGKNNQPDGTGTGMSWFPGYAIDLETGARLHMAFGENSFLGAQNGADMQWNPTSELFDGNGTPVMGGQHPIYVYGTKVGYGGYSTSSPVYDGINNWVYDQYQAATTESYKELFESLVWIANPILAPGHELRETDVRIKVRVNKEYKNFVATGENGGQPMYSWNMDKISTTTASQQQLTSALDLINVVPNPYYAFSEYERTRLDTRVKITNLPDRCTINIYNISGKLIRTFKKDNEITSVDWDLKNNKGIPIASGVYIIHVEVPGAGEKIVKFFGGMRQVDLENI